MYDNFNDVDNAAAAYTEFCLSESKPTQYSGEQANLYGAYRYLANYHMKKGQIDNAYTYAYKCLEYEEVRLILLHLSGVYFFFSNKEKYLN